MSGYMDFSSDRINIFMILVDKSGSMCHDIENVKEGLKLYKKSFENFPDADSIAVSVSMFSDLFYPGEFNKIEDLDTSYDAYGGTALYYSIVRGAEYLNEYVQKVTEKTGVIPKVTYIVMSDGQPCDDEYDNPAGHKKAHNIIESLNYSGTTTVFVAFGEAIESKFGRKLGFMSTIDVNNRDDLVKFIGVELSQSCKEQSKSLKALGANFFSKAVNTKSEPYSQTASQALNDSSWIDDI
jgi:uncharacterized protein YegL